MIFRFFFLFFFFRFLLLGGSLPLPFSSSLAWATMDPKAEVVEAEAEVEQPEVVDDEMRPGFELVELVEVCVISLCLLLLVKRKQANIYYVQYVSGFCSKRHVVS